MSEKRKKYDREFRDGAVRIVEETGKPIAEVARDMGVNPGTLGNWVNRAREDAEGMPDTSGLSSRHRPYEGSQRGHSPDVTPGYTGRHRPYEGSQRRVRSRK